ncbi:MAG TPA: DsrE/DsrF/DrsH-like family protein [Methanomassiliicoccales archaeon]|nr:DsrE/DsrF/DrsH-like family protein [Methanomassiliicoccales archaeon]
MPKLTLVLFSDDLDRAVAAFVIASRAAVEGRQVNVFFSCWGLAVIRDPNKRTAKTGSAEFFDGKMPVGADELKLKHIETSGMGTREFKERMTEKNVQSVREMMREAKEFGVRFAACSLPMEILGFGMEEFVDEVDELCSVNDYLESAKDSDLNLFI